MKEYDAYLFDADGTLMDTRELILQSYLHMGGVLDLPLSERAIQATTGLPVMAQLGILLGEGRGDAFYERARDVYNEYMYSHLDDYLRAFPGAAETLAELQRRGKTLAVVTSRRLKSTDLFLERLGLKRYFSLVVTPECTDTHKPEPGPALYALERLGAAPERSLFIGDAIFDIQCGRAAGMDTAFVVWGGMDPKEWPAQPHWTVNHFHELLY